jgi:GTP cyclohydrolase I
MSAVMPERLQLAPEFREDPIVPLVESMIAHVGENVHRAGLRRTPQRFAEALRFLTSGYQADPEQVIGRGVFAAEGEGTVLVRDIEFFSLCEHHLLPFFGRAHVAYLPGTHIIGLSKIPRLVDLYARRFQVQERLTGQIADALERILEPRGVLVRVEARHLCMAMRGVQKQHSATETLALRGVYADDPHARQETLALLRPAAAAPW